MLGVDTGLLRILFHRKTRQLLGVHIFGERATEIIHIGQAVHGFGCSIDYFRDAVFNYPAMAEVYKVAGLDGNEPSLVGATREQSLFYPLSSRRGRG
jgi:NAD(P) transhydrogenase